jgi:hypothetical protein
LTRSVPWSAADLGQRAHVDTERKRAVASERTRSEHQSRQSAARRC